jgi:hypothetical protein
MIGINLIIMSLIVFVAPLLQIIKNYGDLSSESLIRFLIETRFETRLKLSIAFSIALAMLQFGIFLVVKPR